MKNDRERWKSVKDRIKKNLTQQDINFKCMGSYYSNMMQRDIKHLGFTISRYKFVSKLFEYKNEGCAVCELGCQEGIGALMFQQNTYLKKYVGIDFDEEAISWNHEHLHMPLFHFIKGDIFDDSLLNEKFDVVYSLDVIEHIKREREDAFCEAVLRLMKKEGVAVIGTPNVTMKPYGCEESRIAHINLFDQKRLYDLMNKYFYNVFIFNMNDEVVNQGFAPMSCYIFAVCNNIRR